MSLKQVRKKKAEKTRKVRREVKIRERGTFEAGGKHRKTVVSARRLKPASAPALPAVRLEKVVPKTEIVPTKPEVDLDEEQEPNPELLQAVAEVVETAEAADETETETETAEAVEQVEEAVKPEVVPRERTNAYSLYLREIGKTKLLTPQ